MYETLLIQYDALKDYDMSENRTHSGTDDFTHGHTITDDGQENSKIVSTSNDNNLDNRWGFNSVNKVPTDESIGNSTSTTEGSADDNTVHNERKNTGTDTRITGDEDDMARSGRHSRASNLLSAEIDFRLKNQFYNMVFDHIDEIATLDIYI